MSGGPKAPGLALSTAATFGLLVPLALLDRRMQAAGGPGIIPFAGLGVGWLYGTLARTGRRRANSTQRSAHARM